MGTTASAKAASSGLEDVVIGPSQICDVNGTTGQLIYRGYDIHDLVANTSFEEVIYLLWNGDLPTRTELDALRAELRDCFTLPAGLVSALRTFPKAAEPMDVLRTAVSQLAFTDTERDARVDDRQVNERRAARLTGAISAVVGAWQRIRSGKDPVAPDPELSFAGNLLLLLRGERASDLDTRAMDTALILHADHEINASTFAARVTAATLADLYAAITSAVGTLSGPLHGGANRAVMEMLLEIAQTGADPVAFIKEALAAKRKVMGFGHRVYRTEDPRATHLRELSRQLGEQYGQPQWFQMSRRIEDAVKAEKGLNANVDFYSASTYYVMGIPTDLYTPIFAASRVAGWTAHVLEQYENNRLIRPRAEYMGPRDRKVEPISQRS